MSAQTGDENQPTCVRIFFIFDAFDLACSSVMFIMAFFAASDLACSSVMFIMALSTPSIALRASSKMLVMAWCAHVGSFWPSAPTPMM